MSSRWRTTMRYTLTNARPKPVTVDLLQSGLWGDTRIVEESQPSERRSRRRGALARAGPGQWRGHRHRHLRHALLSRRSRRCAARAPCCRSLLPRCWPRRRRGADGRDLGARRTGSRSPSTATRTATPASRSICEWLNGYALISETRHGHPARRRDRASASKAWPAASCRRARSSPAFRDGIVERNRDAYLLSPATLLDRSLGRRVHHPPHLARRPAR